jgi:DamX protein
MQVKILPSRQALVDRIELQYEYGQSIVTLLGGPGLGKSYILESFVTDKYAEFNKIYLQLTLKTTDQQVISQLLEQTFSQPLIDFTHSLSENFLTLNDQQTSKNTVIVIDNAQFLSEELTHEIEYLTQIAESTFFVLTASTSKIHFQNSANIYFEALSFDESIELMSMYFSQLPNKHEPVFKAFVQSAQGNPSLLLSWDSNSAIEEKKKGKHGFMLMCLAFVVLMTLALSYLFEHLSQSNQIENLRELNVQNIEQSSQVDTQEKSDVKDTNQNIKHNQLDNLPVKELEKNKQADKLTAVSEADKKYSNEIIALTKEKNEAIESTENTMEKVVVSTISKSEKFDDSKQNSKPNLKTSTATPNNIAESLNNTKIVPAKYTELITNDTVVKTQLESQPQKKIIVNDPIVTPAVIYKDYDNAWFMHQSDSLVMLQLIAVSQENLINNFISTHNLNNIKIYKSTRYGGDWWVVTVGPFKDVPQSQAYKNALSTQLKQLQPFSKTIKAIKTEIALLKSI